MTPRFLASVEFTLSWETAYEPGHYGDDAYVVTEHDPNDPGGATRYGIDQRSHPGIDVSTLTLAQSQQIYFDGEWTACRCEDLAPGIGEFVFDTAVNVGEGEAIRLLQEACGASVDGIVGPETLRAANQPGTALLTEIAAIASEREDYYAGLVRRRPSDAEYLTGWDARVSALQTFCAKAATDPQS